MFAAATFLSLLGVSPDADGDVELLAAQLYGEGAVEHVGTFEDAAVLAERARELGDHEGAHVEILWLGEIDAEALTVGGVHLSEFWLEGGAVASVRIRSVDTEGLTLGGFTILPPLRVRPPPARWNQISPTGDHGFMELDFLHPVEFEGGERMDPEDYGQELYPGVQGAAWAPVVGVTEWRVSDGSSSLGAIVAVAPQAHLDGRPLRSINGFRSGYEYWYWSGFSWPSRFEIQRYTIGGSSLQGGPWEVHDDLGFAGTGSSPSGVTTSGTWYEITGGAAGRGNPLGAWLGRKTSAYGLAMTPRNSGTPYMSHDIAELHFMAEPSALFNGRLASDPIEPFVFTAVSPPAGAAHYIWSGNLPQFP